ncbi:MAG TPA: hypothetical protein VJL90_01190 [Pseudorhodoplanes sp.]|nr:hypothetical protein [Pseudorhodoplanes sp.]
MSARRCDIFYGWRVVGAAFVLAVFGLGLGFYGPSAYFQAVREACGFSLPLISAAVTVHFLFGAIVVANLPGLYRRCGVATITKAAAPSLVFGSCRLGLSRAAVSASPRRSSRARDVGRR